MRLRVPNVVLVLMVAVAGPALAGCGSGSEEGTTSSAPAEKRVRGFEFSAVPPAGWTDVGSELEGQGVVYEVTYADTKATGYKPNLTVSRERGALLKGRTLDQVDAVMRDRAAAASADTTVELSTRTRVAGTEARRTIIRASQDNRELIRRQVIVVRNGNLYIVGLASGADDTKAAGILNAFLASWRWNR